MKYEEWSSDRIFHLTAYLRNIKRSDSKGELIKIIRETDLAVDKYTRKDPLGATILELVRPDTKTD